MGQERWRQISDRQSLVGRRLGSYEIHARIGAGGMGEVYGARDTKLARDVAIKILPEAFTSDPDRRTRFAREARVLASLNHPNIAAIYGLEDADGVQGLVLELVEGPTLAEHIQSKQGSGLSPGPKGPGLPLEEALNLARQIAEALEAAHEKGIIHRDLKPANIKVTPDGRAKVLDFGLAKVFADDSASSDFTQSPTITATVPHDGLIVGTAAYMSPEQARGQPVDKRTDIWAFGCVLYEMLSGRPAFSGGTISDTIAAILEREPNWQALPTTTPAKVHDLLHRCLEKNARQRLRDIGDARIELAQVLTVPPKTEPVPAVAARHPPISRQRKALLGSAALAVLAIAAGAVWSLTPASPEPVMRLTMGVSPAEELTGLT